VNERGFTLIETVIAVAIAAILLAAGGVWMLSMHPGALRGAVSDFDANLAAARAIAASSGNGATIAFTPRANHVPGFVMTVYGGRPRGAGMLQATNVMQAVSDATVAEATLGVPPFAIFLSSAGYPSGKAQYPVLDASGNAGFPAIAQQPACPASGGFTLTFTSPGGNASETRTLQCNSTAYGPAVPNPSPQPNPPKIEPPAMVAHWTSDVNAQGGPLQFKVVAYGYYHWYASNDGNGCAGVASQSGAAPATFVSPWPYASPQHASETAASPAPPNAPYTWPSGDPDDPPAWFTMRPVAGNGGTCVIHVADANGQTVSATIQVMGDLTWSNPLDPVHFKSPADAPQVLTFGKTFDGDALVLNEGGPCGGLIAVQQTASTPASSLSTTPTTAQLTITPKRAGSCTMLVGDQYGEPPVPVPIVIDGAAFATWPEQLVLGAADSTIGMAEREHPDLAQTINALFGGATADALTSGCYAAAETAGGAPMPMSAAPALVQQFASANGFTVDDTGCFMSGGSPLQATGSSPVGGIIYEPSQVSRTFNNAGNDTCNGTTATETGWLPANRTGVSVMRLVQPGATSGTCTMALTDGVSSQTLAADKGLVSVTVQGICAPQCLVMSLGWSQTYTGIGVYPGSSVDFQYYYKSSDGVNWTQVAAIGETTEVKCTPIIVGSEPDWHCLPPLSRWMVTVGSQTLVGIGPEPTTGPALALEQQLGSITPQYAGAVECDSSSAGVGQNPTWMGVIWTTPSTGTGGGPAPPGTNGVDLGGYNLGDAAGSCAFPVIVP
jgi:prepilin-type N-terminal cleavage/methylation domain-containing protein